MTCSQPRPAREPSSSPTWVFMRSSKLPEDSLSAATFRRSTRREIRIAANLHHPHILPLGLFVRAELHPEPKRSLVLERRAVLGVEGSHHVFVAKSGVATKRTVEVRDLDARRVEVLSGLLPGDHVLVGPSLPRLAEGTPIAIRTAHVDL